MPDSRWRRALALLFPALLPSLQLFLFGPHTLYAGNPRGVQRAVLEHHRAPGADDPRGHRRSHPYWPGAARAVLSPLPRRIGGSWSRPLDTGQPDRRRLRRAERRGHRLDGTGLAKSLRTGALDRAAAPRHHFRAAVVYRVGVREPHPRRPAGGASRRDSRESQPRGAGEMGRAAGRHLRGLVDPERVPLRARRLSVRCLPRHHRSGTRRDGPQLLGIHVLRQSRRRVPDDDRQHPDDADRTAVPEPGTDAPVHELGLSNADRSST